MDTEVRGSLIWRNVGIFSGLLLVVSESHVYVWGDFGHWTIRIRLQGLVSGEDIDTLGGTD